MKTLKFLLNTLMPLWMVVLGLWSYFDSHLFTVFSPYTSYYLGIVILCMGLTLTPDKLRDGVIRNPKTIFIGFVGKWLWSVLPSVVIALLLLKTLPSLAASTILAGSAPSGASSNLFTYMSGGTVAVSITLTIINTLLAPIFTPLFTKTFANHFVPVHFWSLLWSTAQVVLIPIILGVLIRLVLKKKVDKVEPAFPLVSAVFLYLIDVGTVSKAHAALSTHLSILPLITVVVLLQIFISLILGFLTGKLTRRSVNDTRAMMFETGIYNAGLATVLATGAFGAFAAISPLLNTILNMIIGAILASLIATRDARKKAQFGDVQNTGLESDIS